MNEQREYLIMNKSSVIKQQKFSFWLVIFLLVSHSPAFAMPAADGFGADAGDFAADQRDGGLPSIPENDHEFADEANQINEFELLQNDSGAEECSGSGRGCLNRNGKVYGFLKSVTGWRPWRTKASRVNQPAHAAAASGSADPVASPVASDDTSIVLSSTNAAGSPRASSIANSTERRAPRARRVTDAARGFIRMGADTGNFIKNVAGTGINFIRDTPHMVGRAFDRKAEQAGEQFTKGIISALKGAKKDDKPGEIGTLLSEIGVDVLKGAGRGNQAEEGGSEAGKIGTRFLRSSLEGAGEGSNVDESGTAAGKLGSRFVKSSLEGANEGSHVDEGGTAAGKLGSRFTRNAVDEYQKDDAASEYGFKTARRGLKYWAAAVGITAVAVVGAYFLTRYLERRYFQPDLAIEESEHRVVSYLRSFWSSKKEPTLDDLVFVPETRAQIVGFANELKTATQHGLPLPTSLFVGPSGTGKTAAARIIAKQNGFSYVFISGSSFAQFPESEGLTAMKQLFAWADRHGKAFIFIDEIDFFLASHDKKLTARARAFQSHFLALMSEKSPNYTVVATANRPQDLDVAVARRFTDTILMALPTAAARTDLLRFYFKRLILEDKAFNIRVQNQFIHDESYLAELTEETKGFSAADMRDVVETSKLLTLGKSKPVLTPVVVHKAVDRIREKKRTIGVQPLPDQLDSEADSMAAEVA